VPYNNAFNERSPDAGGEFCNNVLRAAGSRQSGDPGGVPSWVLCKDVGKGSSNDALGEINPGLSNR
jgi:hypothetical protein